MATHTTCRWFTILQTWQKAEHAWGLDNNATFTSNSPAMPGIKDALQACQERMRRHRRIWKCFEYGTLDTCTAKRVVLAPNPDSIWARVFWSSGQLWEHHRYLLPTSSNLFIMQPELFVFNNEDLCNLGILGSNKIPWIFYLTSSECGRHG